MRQYRISRRKEFVDALQVTLCAVPFLFHHVQLNTIILFCTSICHSERALYEIPLVSFSLPDLPSNHLFLH